MLRDLDTALFVTADSRGFSHFCRHVRCYCGWSVRRSSTYSPIPRTSTSTSTSTPRFHFQLSPSATRVRTGSQVRWPECFAIHRNVSKFPTCRTGTPHLKTEPRWNRFFLQFMYWFSILTPKLLRIPNSQCLRSISYLWSMLLYNVVFQQNVRKSFAHFQAKSSKNSRI